MIARIATVSVMILFASEAFAQAPELPKQAIQLKGDEIAKFLDGKTFSVKIYDAGGELTAETKWDWANKKVFGTYVYNGNKGEFSNDWIIKGDKSCAEKSPKGKLICQGVFVDGTTVYEVNSKGKLHAVSVQE